jgi:Spy/CpxP family protein refolding chaperone
MSQRRMKLYAGLIAVALLVVGGIGGIALDRTLNPTVAAPHRLGSLLEQFVAHLELDQQQATKVEAILEDVRTEADELDRLQRKERHDIQIRAQGRILEVLTPEQAEEYMRMLDEAHARARAERKAAEAR